MTLVQGISGVRGIYGQSLDLLTIKKFSAAFSSVISKGPVLVARDTRPHGEGLSTTCIDTLINQNRKVYDAGIIPTPTAQLYIKKNKFAGGIVITASHNPMDWNGMKFINQDGLFFNHGHNQKLFNEAKKDILNNQNIISNHKKITNCIEQHIKQIIKVPLINIKAIQNHKFHVVTDTTNGAASLALPALLRELGCHVTSIYNKTNSKVFPRGPEPIEKNLKELSKAVIINKANLGFATDPDGDRLSIVDNKGNILGEESTLPICMLGLLLKNKIKNNVVVNLSTSMMIEKLAKKHSTNVIKSAIGERNVIELMIKEKSNFGGEGNGGVIFPNLHYARDALIGSALALNTLVETKTEMEEVHKMIPKFYMIKDKVIVQKLNEKQTIEYFKETFPKAKFNFQDGIKCIENNFWIHIRKSNTEPVIRIIAEHHDLTSLKKIINNFKLFLSH